jgi:outer membrane protein assembly factor BamB
VPGQHIAGHGHDVLYVVTENNSVYALDAHTGAVLLQRNLGPAVPPLFGCNSATHIGINSTPVVDLQRGEIIVIAYVNGATPSYQLHALSLTTLLDTIPSITVAATKTLTDGTTFAFNAVNQRQRPGLLEQNSVIYAGFGSFCDYNASVSRGWVMGWRVDHDRFVPLENAKLTDTQATTPFNWFLSSVWMSGFGLAGDNAHVYFTTGNSDCDVFRNPAKCPPKSTYDGVTDIQESAVSMNLHLAQQDGIFTPSNVLELDGGDLDLSAGGIMVIPNAGIGFNLAAVAGKDGRLFLLDRDNMSKALDVQQLPTGCWCGPSYFLGADGIGRIVTSAGALQTWQIQTAPGPHLVAEATVNLPASVEDPGFFTSVSSNGGNLDSAIIWAVNRPSANARLTLYAFAAAAKNGTFKQLYSAPAGPWPNLNANANTVPVVANGKVYVASYKTLTIFGPYKLDAAAEAGPVDAGARLSEVDDATRSVDSLPPGATKRVTGTLLAIDGSTLTISTRTGRTVTVDASAAIENEKAAVLNVGQAYTAFGAATGFSETVSVTAIERAKPGVGAWPADRW